MDDDNLLSQNKIRIYILNTEKYIDFDIKQEETFLNLKKKVLSKLENVVNLNLKYHTIEGYEFRYVHKLPLSFFSKLEKNRNNFPPNMGTSPINDDDTINEIGKDSLCFIEKRDYINLENNKNSKAPKLYGAILDNNNEELKINIKVYIKVNKDNISSTIVQLNTKNNLKSVFDKILLKNKLRYRNIDLYYFVEHEEGNNEDMDNALSWEMELKYLSTYELDLFRKKFADLPNYPEMSQSYILNLSENSYKSKSEDNDSLQEYIFNENTAGVYQEFDVVKINKFGNKQERTLGIDMYNLYNDMPKNKKNTSGLFNFHSKTKKPLRKIKDIQECGVISDNSFFIIICDSDENNGIRELKYEVKNKNIRNEILAKINYLLKMNNNLKKKINKNTYK